MESLVLRHTQNTRIPSVLRVAHESQLQLPESMNVLGSVFCIVSVHPLSRTCPYRWIPKILRMVQPRNLNPTCQFHVSGTTLSETNSKFAPENGWLEYNRFLLGWPIFRGYVTCREGQTPKNSKTFQASVTPFPLQKAPQHKTSKN